MHKKIGGIAALYLAAAYAIGMVFIVLLRSTRSPASETDVQR